MQFPDNESAKLIVQARISEVVYLTREVHAQLVCFRLVVCLFVLGVARTGVVHAFLHVHSCFIILSTPHSPNQCTYVRMFILFLFVG